MSQRYRRRSFAGAFVTSTMLASFALAGCHGGGGGDGSGGASGGGGGGGGSGSPSVTVTPSSVAFVAFTSTQTSEAKSLTIGWTGANVAGYAVGTLPGVPAPPFWLTLLNAQNNANPSTLTLRRGAIALPTGQYSTTLRVVTGDANLNPISQADISVTLEVLPVPTVSPPTLTPTWIESEQPAAQQFAVTHSDPRIQLVSATPNVSWLAATTAGDTVTVTGTAAARTLLPGNAPPASVRLAFSITGGGDTSIDVPVNGQVGYAFVGAPAMSAVELEVNGSTTAQSLANRTATVTTRTQAPVQFNATTNVAWLTGGTGFTTGTANNLVLQLQGNEIKQLPDGEHMGLITLTPTTPNVSVAQIPVRLKLRLPEVDFVAPVAFSNTVTTDYVVVHGRGLNDPNADLRVNNVPVDNAHKTIVNDTTVRVVPGALAAGDYAVTVSNLLGYPRDGGTLRVVDPPAYGAFSLDVNLGPQSRVISSPVNRAVFTASCYFCTSSIGTPSLVHRFAYDSLTTQWTHTEKAYDHLFDIALTPDESKLIVITQTQLLLADPVTLTAAPADTFALPGFAGGFAHQLAVANDGLVLIGDLAQAFSLRTRTFVTAPASYVLGRAPAASRDGSRILLPMTLANPDPIQYYDPATGTISTASTDGRDTSASLSRHATTAASGGKILDAAFAVRGTLPDFLGGQLSPDGTRFYYPDVNTSDLRVFDVSGAAPFPEVLPAIDVPGVPNSRQAQIGVDPSGGAAFYVTEQKFVVLDLP